jgi:hypothetical protein
MPVANDDLSWRGPAYGTAYVLSSSGIVIGGADAHADHDSVFPIPNLRPVRPNARLPFPPARQSHSRASQTV